MYTTPFGRARRGPGGDSGGRDLLRPQCAGAARERAALREVVLVDVRGLVHEPTRDRGARPVAAGPRQCLRHGDARPRRGLRRDARRDADPSVISCRPYH